MEGRNLSVLEAATISCNYELCFTDSFCIGCDPKVRQYVDQKCPHCSCTSTLLSPGGFADIDNFYNE